MVYVCYRTAWLLIPENEAAAPRSLAFGALQRLKLRERAFRG